MITRRKAIAGSALSTCWTVLGVAEEKKQRALRIEYVSVNKLNISFQNRAESPWVIWEPNGFKFWSAVRMVCRLKSKEREWRIWRERAFHDRMSTLKIESGKTFELVLEMDDGTWPAVGRISAGREAVGHTCDCWIEWEPNGAKAQNVDILPMKLASNAITIALVLRGIF